ncbi:MAG: hypothetical protein ABFR95_11320 [Actinomycetota bacterium]
MFGILFVGALFVAVGLLILWLRRRRRSVDDYFERDHGDPPAGMSPPW